MDKPLRKFEVRIVSMVSIWSTPWVAGFMFTVGYVGVPWEALASSPWYVQWVAWVISFLVWPLTLGHTLAGG